MTTINPGTLPLDALAAVVQGPVFAGDDPRAAADVTTFNLAVTHRPAAVVGATSAQDVAAAVAWAAERRLPVAVQATGHGPVRGADGALLVNTSRMQGVTVDPVRRTATAAAGARWADVLAAVTPHGLAPLSGSSSHVGVVGYTLGGGMGSLAREHGFAADVVERVEIVTADGRIRQVDAEHDPDLFWAVRGGKGNFGVVTSLEFGLAPVSDIYGGSAFFTADSAPDVLHTFRAWAPALPEQATTSVALMRVPQMEEVPEPLRGKFVVALRFAYSGDALEGERLIAPMMAAGEIVLGGFTAMPYAAADAIHQDPTEPLPFWERGWLLGELPEAAVDTLLAAAGPEVDVPLIMVELRLLGGAMARQPKVPNAVSGREAAFSLFVLGPLAPGLEEVVPMVGGGLLDAMGPWLTGTGQLNFLGDALTADAVALAWTPEVHRRLLEVKEQLDPGNLFCHGHALVDRA